MPQRARWSRLPAEPAPERKPRARAEPGRWRCVTLVAGFYPCGEELDSWAACERHAKADHAVGATFEQVIEQPEETQ